MISDDASVVGSAGFNEAADTLVPVFGDEDDEGAAAETKTDDASAAADPD